MIGNSSQFPGWGRTTEYTHGDPQADRCHQAKRHGDHRENHHWENLEKDWNKIEHFDYWRAFEQSEGSGGVSLG